METLSPASNGKRHSFHIPYRDTERREKRNGRKKQKGLLAPNINESRFINWLLKRGLSVEKATRTLTIRRETGGNLFNILLYESIVARESLYRAAALYLNIPFLGEGQFLGRLKAIDPETTQKIAPHEAARLMTLPLKEHQGRLFLITAIPENPDMLAFFRKHYGNLAIRQIVVSDRFIRRLIVRHYGTDFHERSINSLLNRNPEESAARTFTGSQIILFISAILLAIASFAVAPKETATVILFTVQLLYLVFVGFKFLLAVAGSLDELRHDDDLREAELLNDASLPVYTVLIPVYKEAEVIGSLIDSLGRLDYPKDRLDVLLLMEEDDKETPAAAEAANLPPFIHPVIVPHSIPKTKAKACNYGVLLARGTLLTIYDAEDIPDPLQLKTAADAFSKSDTNVMCFQAALNYFNEKQNVLTRFFTLEYSYWFDFMLPGLNRLRLPIPLGGTSNHFRLSILTELGGWDPFNTTEDADLGIRASAESYRIGIIRSTTYEEANSQVWNWIRQRTRWIKGYMQTALVYNRHPFKALRTLGFKAWISFQLFITGTPLTFLINPFLWILFALTVIGGNAWLNALFTDTILLIALTNLFIGNFLAIYLNMVGVFHRSLFELVPLALLNPFYWVLHSIASYRALFQLLTRPHYWDKTDHGLTSSKR